MEEMKTAVITGASGGIGSAATAEMAARGYRVIMACRDLAKTAKVREEILRKQPDAQLIIEQVSLDSLSSIVNLAERLEKYAPIDVLFNNAGVLPRHYSLSEDGYELTLAVNYLAPYLLSRKLLPLLGKGARVVNMISLSGKVARFDHDFFNKDAKLFGQLKTYSATKFALTLFSIALGEKCGVKVNVADPGIVNTKMIRLERWFDPLTDLFFRPFCHSPERGALPAVNAMCSESGGKMFIGRKEKEIPKMYTNRKEDKEWLWAATEKLIKDYL